MRKHKNGYVISTFWIVMLLFLLFDATVNDEPLVFRVRESFSIPSNTEPILEPDVVKPRINPDTPADTLQDTPGFGIMWLVIPLSILLAGAFKLQSFLDDPANRELVHELFNKSKEDTDQ